MALIKAPTGRVGHQADIRAGGRVITDLRQQRAQYGVAQASSLMLRKYGHVEHVEVPTAVAEEPSHAHRRAC